MIKKKNNKSFKTKAKQKLFIASFKKNYGIVTRTCLAVNIHRSTYYDWINKDEEFIEMLRKSRVEEEVQDLIESELFEQVFDKKNVKVLLYLASIKLKNRGYSEGANNQLTESINFNINVNFISNNKKKEPKLIEQDKNQSILLE